MPGFENRGWENGSAGAHDYLYWRVPPTSRYKVLIKTGLFVGISTMIVVEIDVWRNCHEICGVIKIDLSTTQLEL